MRHNVFTLSYIELITGEESSINVGDTWKDKDLNEITIQQLFSGDCSDYNILSTEGKFHKKSDLVILEKRRMKTI